MTDHLVEKVGNALEASPGLESLLCSEIDLAAEAAIQSVFDELGLKEEREPGNALHWLYFRFVSDWRSVEQGDADGD